MLTLRFTPWGRFCAIKDDAAIKDWLRDVTDAARDIFRAGMTGPHSGRLYRRRGRIHKASAPGEYPANDSGRLLKTAKTVVTPDEGEFGVNIFYARFLAHGTRKMAKRRMAKEAMQHGMGKAKLRQFARFER